MHLKTYVRSELTSKCVSEREKEGENEQKSDYEI